MIYIFFFGDDVGEIYLIGFCFDLENGMEYWTKRIVLAQLPQPFHLEFPVNGNCWDRCTNTDVTRLGQ